MEDRYFPRVVRETSTRLWINNPTSEEISKAIEAGAISCTTNPSYCAGMLKSEAEHESVLKIVDEVIHQTDDNRETANLVQQKLVARIMDRFLSLYEDKPGEQGFVSIQGDPYGDADTEHIIKEALEYQKLGRNFIAKIPATKEGLQAIEYLIKKDIPIIATEVMAISQAIATCEIYKRASEESGRRPPFYLTHITGIYDEYLANIVKRDGIEISQDVLSKAGTIIAHKQYQILKERGYFGIMLGGGVRRIHHFTEMIGGNIHVTMNWSTVEELIEANPPIVSRVDDRISQDIVDELCKKIDDFDKAFSVDGLTIDEFRNFGPVDYFRSKFVAGWDLLMDTIEQRRKMDR